MENLGQYLQGIRTSKNLSLEQVHSEIKLSLDQLNKIENNQLASLGALGIAKATVYTYVRFLGADEKLSMNLFDTIWPSHKQTHFTPKLPLKEKKVLISTNFIWVIAIILITILLGSIIWISYSRGYLKRPFEKAANSTDTLQNVDNVPLKESKPDTLHARMVQLTRNVQKQPATASHTPVKEKLKKAKTVADTTDFVNDLIFNDQDSPFNSRF
jgi:cytoskeletal protein RodZ